MSKANGVLDLVMKNVWFDKIKAGEKKIEYREVKKSWASKIYENGKPAVKLALFSRDYRRKEQMLFEIEKIEVLTSGIETDLKINKPVYAIHLGKQLNIVDWYKEQNKCPIYKLKQQLQEKEKECEELKEKLYQIEDIIEPLNFELPEDRVIRELSLIVNGCIKRKPNLYKQALVEIEENIKAMNNECFYDDICECNNCDMKNGCTYYRKFNILNIINKAKGGVNGNT